jgi:hypothetical protein
VAKNPNFRAIRSARSYTIPEIADVLGVSIGTVRGWVRAGLPALVAQRPILVIGSELREFLETRRVNAKATLEVDQLYCLTCKSPRRPFGLMVDLYGQSPKTARLQGLCELCGGTCNRMISCQQIDRFASIFDIARKDMMSA